MWLVLLVLALVAQARSATAQDLMHLHVAQGRAAPPAITLYLDVLDAADRPPESLAPSALTVSVGDQAARVTALRSFASTGEGVGFIFLVDVSASLSTREMRAIQQAVRSWVDDLKPIDRAALITFGDQATVAADFTNDRAVLDGAVDSLKPIGSKTTLHLALRQALELGRRRDVGLPERRAIVILSDGKDEGSSLTEDDVAATILEERVPIYSIGYSRLRGDDRRRGLDALGRFSADSGGLFNEATDIAATYAAMRQAIARVFVASAECPGCTGDGRLEHVRVALNAGTRVLTDGMDVRLEASERADSSSDRTKIPVASPSRAVWPLAAAGVAAFLLLVGLVIVRGRSRRTDALGPTPRSPVDAPLPAAAVATPAPAFRVTLHFRRGGVEPIAAAVDRSLLMGTSPECGLCLPEDPDASPKHCELIVDRGRLLIRPLEAATPTFVNGVPVSTRLALESGDLIMIGRTEMRMIVEALS